MNSRTAGRRTAGRGQVRLALAGTAGGAALVMALGACSAGGTAQMAKKVALVPKLTISFADGSAWAMDVPRVVKKQGDTNRIVELLGG